MKQHKMNNVSTKVAENYAYLRPPRYNTRNGFSFQLSANPSSTELHGVFQTKTEPRGPQGGAALSPRSLRFNTRQDVHRRQMSVTARALSDSKVPPSLLCWHRNPRYRLPLPSTSLSQSSPFPSEEASSPYRTVQIHVHYQRICHWRLHFQGGSLTSPPTDHHVVFCQNPAANETHQSILRWARRRTTLFAAREAIFARVLFRPESEKPARKFH